MEVQNHSKEGLPCGHPRLDDSTFITNIKCFKSQNIMNKSNVLS